MFNGYRAKRRCVYTSVPHRPPRLTASHEVAGRQVLIEPVATKAACPSCKVLTARIRTTPAHRVKDLSAGDDDLQVLVWKRRMACQEPVSENGVPSWKPLTGCPFAAGLPPGPPNNG